MITKEKFMKGYIVNDMGSLRKAWFDAAQHFGLNRVHSRSLVWFDYNYCYINDSEGADTTQYNPEEYNVDSFGGDDTFELTLGDLCDFGSQNQEIEHAKGLLLEALDILNAL